MKLIGMFQDLIESLFKKSATQTYPYKKNPVPDRYHGRLDYDASKCTGCMMCVRDCPAETIKIKVIDRKTKQFVMTYNIGECVYCKQCVFNCKFDALHMTNLMWESASDSKEGFQLYFGKQEHIDGLLGKKTEEEPATAEAKAQ
ncbi:MAG: 4Fe-4S binding protein [Flexilinea sp.]